MKLATKKDIEAPIGQVWSVMSDIEGWERSAMRRGVELERTDKLPKVGPGMSWSSRFTFRGRERNAQMKLTDLSEPSLMGFVLTSPAVEVTSRLELIEMGAKRTRLHYVAEFKPRSLGARLFLQSLRLARAKVDRKFDKRVAQLAQELEQRAKGLK